MPSPAPTLNAANFLSMSRVHGYDSPGSYGCWATAVSGDGSMIMCVGESITFSRNGNVYSWRPPDTYGIANAWIGNADAYTFDLSYTGQYVALAIANFGSQNNGALALSSDYGVTFTSPNSIPPHSIMVQGWTNYREVMVPPGKYCLLYYGVYISPDGQTIVAYCRTNAYTTSGPYQFQLSRDQGVTWTLLVTTMDLTALSGTSTNGCNTPSFTASEGFKIFATTCIGDVYVSKDYGATFTFSSNFRTVNANAGLQNQATFRLVCNKDCTRMAVASQTKANVIISTDFGNTWVVRTPGVDSGMNGLANLAMNAGGFIIIAAYQSSVQFLYLSKDGGTTWVKWPVNFSSLYSQYTNMCGMRLSSNGLTLTFATCWNTSPRYQGAVYIDNSYP